MKQRSPFLFFFLGVLWTAVLIARLVENGWRFQMSMIPVISGMIVFFGMGIYFAVQLMKKKHSYIPEEKTPEN